MCEEINDTISKFNNGGWRNRETYIAILWIGSEEGLYNAAMSVMKRNKGNDQPKALHEFFDEVLSETVGVGMSLDLLRYSLHKIDWTDIAAYLYEK